LKCIPEEDVERCQKFRFKRDAKFALISSLLKIQVVHQHLQIPVKDIQFTKTKFGKPIFVFFFLCFLYFFDQIML